MRSRRPRFVVAALVVGAILIHRRHPSPIPYGLRLFVQLPKPLLTRSRLTRILEPERGERILEVGPGTGYYTLELSERVGSDGAIDIFDIRQEFLDHTMRAAAQRGISNVRPTRGDARSLPYEDGTFDAAVLITVLGEIAELDAALSELKRVLRPGGRLVVGEVVEDPDFVRPRSLGRRANLCFERRLGPPFAYFARFAA